MQHYVNRFLEKTLLPDIFRNDLGKEVVDNLSKLKESISYFSYGSTIYKNKPASDYDYIVVSDFEKEQFEDVFCVRGQTVSIQITFYTLETFLKMLQENEISALECLSLEMKYYDNLIGEEANKENEILFNLSRSLFEEKIKQSLPNVQPHVIRTAISKKASNSYVKAKKKIILKEDFDLKVSLKSLWHSFRMVGFALESVMSNHGEISCFDIANDLYSEIAEDYLEFHSFSDPDSFWTFIHEKYQPRHNALMSVFRQYAPKQGVSDKQRLTYDEFYNIVNKGYLVNPMEEFKPEKTDQKTNLEDTDKLPF